MSCSILDNDLHPIILYHVLTIMHYDLCIWDWVEGLRLCHMRLSTVRWKTIGTRTLPDFLSGPTAKASLRADRLVIGRRLSN